MQVDRKEGKYKLHREQKQKEEGEKIGEDEIEERWMGMVGEA